MAETPTRTWGGSTLTDRRATRRGQLLESGLDLLGAETGSTVSVRAVCRGARLTERYFYESFADREDFVLAVYEHVASTAHHALTESVRDAPAEPEARAAAAVTAFVELMVDDPRKGRVLLLAPITDPALSTRGVQLIPTFAELIREELPPELDELERRMTAVGLVGSLTNLFIAHLDGTLTVPRERLIAHCVRLLVRALG